MWIINKAIAAYISTITEALGYITNIISKILLILLLLL